MSEISSRDQVEVISGSSSSEEGVFLPCDQHHFGEFISKLLGRPQRLEKLIFGHFEISESDVINFHHLIDQRIKQQNESHLVSVTFNVVYDDDSTSTFTSLVDFKSRVEVESKRSIGIFIEWVYLVKFNDRDTSEKQTIEINIATNDESATITKEVEGVVRLNRLPKLLEGHIFIRINHTAKTWGHDIESILIKHSKKLLINDNKIMRFINKNSGSIGLATFIIIFATAIMHTILSTKKLVNDLKKSVDNLSINSTDKFDAMQKKLDFVIDVTAKGVWHKHYNDNALLLLIMFMLAILISVWVSRSANNRPKSFLLLTPESETYRQKIINKYNRKWLSFAAAIFVGILTSVFGNYLFEYLKKM